MLLEQPEGSSSQAELPMDAVSWPPNVRAPYLNAKTNHCFFCTPYSALEGKLNKQGGSQDLLQQSPAVGSRGTGTGRVKAQAYFSVQPKLQWQKFC